MRERTGRMEAEAAGAERQRMDEGREREGRGCR